MEDKIIKISVAPTGEAKIEAEGFKGGVCKTATAPFEKIYGGKVISHKDKPELYEGASCEAPKVNA